MNDIEKKLRQLDELEAMVGKIGKLIHTQEGAELKQKRKELGLTQRQASQQSAVSVSTWYRWESGKLEIPDSVLKLYKIDTRN
jgi:DNA-binding transcriptional regulator YiaG